MAENDTHTLEIYRSKTMDYSLRKINVKRLQQNLISTPMCISSTFSKNYNEKKQTMTENEALEITLKNKPWTI